MIHPWVDSSYFAWILSKMNFWNPFKRRFKSRFMIPSGFPLVGPVINTWGFNQWFFWVSSGDSWVKFQLSFFWVFLESSFEWILFRFCLEFLGPFWVVLRIQSMNQLKTTWWNHYKVYYTGFFRVCQALCVYLDLIESLSRSNLYKVIYAFQDLHMRKSVV